MSFINKYFAVFKMGLADAFQYRFNFFMQIFLWYFPLVIQVLLWSAVYKSNGKSEIAGYTLKTMITYYIIVMIVNEFVKTEGIEWSIISDIRDGNLRRFLVQPIDFLLFKLVYVSSKKIVVVACVLINLIPLFFFFQDLIKLPLKPLNFIFFGAFLVFSLLIFYFINTAIAMLSFWFTEFTAIFHFLPFVFAVVNGTAFPLNILPGWLNEILSYTPFYYVVYFPTQVLMGKMDMKMVGQGLCVQIIWLLICTLVCKLIWSKGIQEFSATGG